jgi:heterodisulfide reductase subunit C
MITPIIFGVITLVAIAFFTWNVRKIIRNIKLGRDLDRSDNKGQRWKTMLLVAFGQQKMFARPIPALLHLCIYGAFVITQIELIEIFIDGVFGTHRVFMEMLGGFYTFIISFIEILSVLAFLATLAFLARRNLLKLPRFHWPEMKGWPKLDGNLILYAELVLIIFIFMMNGAGEVMHVSATGESMGFTISQFIGPALLGGMDAGALHTVEQIGWWGHIIVVFAFLNYLPYSKHFHIILAFPNTYYSNLKAKGEFNNLENVKKEVMLMMDPNADPYAAPPEPVEGEEPGKFGAKDVGDLTWKSLLDSYTCTECGRCTSNCPASQTGKLLSPRKIMMDTRDRLEEVGKNIDKHGKDHDDGKSLLHDYITEEELRACTSCNACTDACPVNIDPLTIIVDLRRFLVMEESKSPDEWTTMFNNIENNGAPWAFPVADRMKWAEED